VQIFEKVSFYLSQYNQEQGEIELTILRNGEKKVISLKPKWDVDTKMWRIGFAAQPVQGSIGQILYYSFHRMIFLVHITVSGFVQLFTNQVSRDMVAGPVGIVKVIGETYQVGLKYSVLTAIANVLWLAAALSANLGALNLFPIPALDGSRLVFLAIEGIRKRPVNPEKENMIHFVGLVVLMLFMLYITYGDVVQLIK
ncbi:MAG: hypothetical protein GX347_03280, partial [Epulopiscium sp.]|nr:hypothetical protein [Candidatus Epulonipiscium sp.]